MRQCLLQREIAIKLMMVMRDWCHKSIWVSLSGGVSAVFPVHEPGGLQLCHWRQPHRWIHVLWGFPRTYYTDLLPSKNLAAKSFPTPGHCLLLLSFLYFLCRLTLPGRLIFNKPSVLYVLNEKFCLLKFFSVCASNQKQIQITIWWWDEQACLVFCSW